jgi:hypothetical protein
MRDDKALGREEALRLDRLLLTSTRTDEASRLLHHRTNTPAQTPLVLVVDDDVALTEQLKVEGEGVVWGMRIETAPDLTTARQKIAQAPPDVILLELSFSRSSRRWTNAAAGTSGAIFYNSRSGIHRTR